MYQKAEDIYSDSESYYLWNFEQAANPIWPPRVICTITVMDQLVSEILSIPMILFNSVDV